MMKTLLFAVLAAVASTTPTIDVLFSPHGGCTDRIVAELGRAKTSIQVQAYSFTSAPIAKAILEAHKRGVKCAVVLDSSQRTRKYSSLTFFHNQGIPVWIDSMHAIAHNKIIIIDGSTIITGSFNFSKAAETRNAENLLIIAGFPELALKYVSNFHWHRSHSQASIKTSP